MTTVAGLCGLLVVGGVWLAVAGLRPSPAHTPPPRRQLEVTVPPERLLVALGSAAGGLLLTRWPAVGVIGGLAGWLVPLRRDRVDDAARAEAIALWAEMLRDAVGTARGVEGVLVVTASAAPAAIRDDVQRITRRLTYEPLEMVLPDLAAILAHPIGDMVVASIQLAAQTGGRHLASQLDSLATAAHAEAAMHRRVEVARQQPRSTMRTVAAFIVGFTSLLFVWADDWMQAYDRPAGQLILVMVAALMTAGFWWMARMGRIPTPERFYIQGPQ